MPENTRPNPSTLLTGGVLVIALAAVFMAGSSLSDDDAIEPASTNINTATQPTGIVTTGTGSVDGTPDQLQFSISVTNQRSSTEDALAATSADVRALTAAVKKSGVDAKDVRTTGLSLRPDYDYSGSGRRIVGYTASTRLRVLVRELTISGKVITAASTAAGNAASVGGIQLRISNQDALVEEARQKAVADAKAAAEALADAAGRKVGRLIYVEEGSGRGFDEDSYYKNMRVAAQSFSALSASVPISPGQQKLAVTVQVRWAVD